MWQILSLFCRWWRSRPGLGRYRARTAEQQSMSDFVSCRILPRHQLQTAFVYGTRTFFNLFCKVLTSVFCLFANCLLSAQGVSPEMSARAASTDPKPIAAARAVAAKTVWIGLLASCDWAEQLTERSVCGLLRGRAAFTGLNEDLEVRSLVCACTRNDSLLIPRHASTSDQKRACTVAPYLHHAAGGQHCGCHDDIDWSFDESSLSQAACSLVRSQKSLSQSLSHPAIHVQYIKIRFARSPCASVRAVTDIYEIHAGSHSTASNLPGHRRDVRRQQYKRHLAVGLGLMQ